MRLNKTADVQFQLRDISVFPVHGNCHSYAVFLKFFTLCTQYEQTSVCLGLRFLLQLCTRPLVSKPGASQRAAFTYRVL